MSGLFISYRREQTQHAAGRLKDDLGEAFEPGTRIFRDIEDIEPGLDFTEALDRALKESAVMLVLIGPGWTDARDPQGRRRLELPHDWVRLEVATALRRNIRVVPVLLEGTPMPGTDKLPEDLHPLALRQAFELADGRWRTDVQRLVEALAKVPGLVRRPPPAPAPGPAPVPPAPAPAPSTLKPLLKGVGIGVLGLLAVAVYLSESGTSSAPSGPDPAPAPGPAPVPAPSPAPAPVRAPDPEPAPEPLPNLSGLWRTNSGETYRFTQNGRSVSFTAHAGGLQVGQGQGELEGQLLRLSMTMQLNGLPLGAANCDMQPSTPDGRAWTGLCMGPNGAFAAQMFR